MVGDDGKRTKGMGWASLSSETRNGMCSDAHG
jgi:hypothetical protein